MNKYEHTYRVFKSSWGINIKIIAEITSTKNYAENNNYDKICDGLMAGYASKPLAKGEKFLEEDKIFLWEGLKRVGDLIVKSSPYKSDTLIIIHSLVFSLCDFQEEGLTAAIIEWSANAFGFQAPIINVSFNKEYNKYEFRY
jgi:hypothetical protein